jgi:3D (Asp-Asp-Asp) domain-containing protein
MVRTTAYSHQESDSLKYGKKSAAGSNLKYGNLVRSAAADWSVYPVGTLFRIVGEPHLYEVDDYGSALVGTGTIDIYKPTMSSMRAWGVRHVPIEIVRWGSYERSLTILEPRTRKASHVRHMVDSIQSKTST